MNLIVGATGLLGSEVCRILTNQGKHVRALVRSTSDRTKIGMLKDYGASVFYGDLKDTSSLIEACHGVKIVISTASSTISHQPGDTIQTVDLDGQLNLINAAKEMGVNQFIFVSFLNHPQIQYPLTITKRKVERRLHNSGLDYTILQASYFMEVWLSPSLGFDYNNGNVRIYGNGENKICWISYKDVAKFIAASIDNDAVRNMTIEIGGPEALSPKQVVKIFEEQSRRKFKTEYISEDNLHTQKRNATDSLQESFAGLMLQYAHGDKIDMKKILKIFPINLTSVKDYARSVLQ